MPPDNSTIRCRACPRATGRAAIVRCRRDRGARPNSPRLNVAARRDGGEISERDLLRNEADDRPRRAIVANDVMAVDEDLARSHRHRAADDPDQRRLAGPVRAEKGENLALGRFRDRSSRARRAPNCSVWSPRRSISSAASPFPPGALMGAAYGAATAARAWAGGREPPAASPLCRRVEDARHPPARVASQESRAARNASDGDEDLPSPCTGIRSPSARRSSRRPTDRWPRHPGRRSSNLHPG